VGSSPTLSAFPKGSTRSVKASRKQPKNAVSPRLEKQTTSTAGLDGTIESVTKNLSVPYFGSLLRKLAAASPHNAFVICEHILAEQTQYNAKASTIEGKLKRLVWLSRYLNNKPFEEMTKQDILLYLNSRRKSLDDDPKQKWIGFYNSCRIVFSKFFRWYYNKDQPDVRLWETPPCMQGIRQLPKTEISPYKSSDLWTEEEHRVFLKYCPDPRDRCFHAMADDLSARPHEILNLRVEEIKFKITEDGTQYAEVLIHGGKTKPRTLPIIDSLPYVKEWLQVHPTGSNKKSWLFISQAHQSYGEKLREPGLWDRYARHYKEGYFTRLLNDETVPESDKTIIREMLQKPWNPYIFRHTALTAKSQILPEFPFRDHGGWSPTSKMPRVYLHYFGTESSKKLLEAKGIIKPGKTETELPKTKPCPHCKEPNKPEAKFCIRCRMVLTYDAYEASNDRLKRLEEKMALYDNLLSDPVKLKEMLGSP
jgi:integrase